MLVDRFERDQAVRPAEYAVKVLTRIGLGENHRGAEKTRRFDLVDIRRTVDDSNGPCFSGSSVTLYWHCGEGAGRNEFARYVVRKEALS